MLARGQQPTEMETPAELCWMRSLPGRCKGRDLSLRWRWRGRRESGHPNVELTAQARQQESFVPRISNERRIQPADSGKITQFFYLSVDQNREIVFRSAFPADE